MKKKNIKVEPVWCSGCLSCQLRCSFFYTGVFNPTKAGINIEPGRISFTDECVENCSLCTKYCAYRAITQVGGK